MNVETLVTSAQQGDKDAFSKLIKGLEPSFYKISKAILSSNSDCLDATQETIIIAFTSINQVREPKYFKTWITRILINECNKIRKKQAKIVNLDGTSAEPSVVEQHDSTLDLKIAISYLDDELRTVITLYYYEGFSVKEMASILDIAEGTVKSRLNRARTKLFSLLDEKNKEGRMLT